MFSHINEDFPRPQFWTLGKKWGERKERKLDSETDFSREGKGGGYVRVCSEQDNKHEKYVCHILTNIQVSTFQKGIK